MQVALRRRPRTVAGLVVTFNLCLVVTSFLIGCNVFLALSHTTQLNKSCLAAHWTMRSLLTTIQEPAGISLEFLIHYHLLSKGPFPVLLFNVFMTTRAFGLLLGKLAGPPSVTLPARVD